MMRLEFMQRQRAWEAELARAAPGMEDEASDEEEVVGARGAMAVSEPGTRGVVPPEEEEEEEEELDEVLRREREEMEALLAMMPGQGMREVKEEGEAEEDEEDFDALFDQVMGGEQNQAQLQQLQQYAPGPQQSEEMDLS